jgi:hypothetical protein
VGGLFFVCPPLLHFSHVFIFVICLLILYSVSSSPVLRFENHVLEFLGFRFTANWFMESSLGYPHLWTSIFILYTS